MSGSCEEHALIMSKLVLVDHAGVLLAERKSATAHTISIFKASLIGDHIAVRPVEDTILIPLICQLHVTSPAAKVNPVKSTNECYAW